MTRIHLIIFATALALGVLCGAVVAHGSNPGPILATLQRLELWRGDAAEDPIARAERLQDIAAAVRSASSSSEIQAALLTLGEAETHFGAYTQHPTTCVTGPRGMRCDNGRARSYWQLHRAACPALFELPPGDERAVYVAAQCAATLLRWGRYTCGSWHGAYAAYAGRRCSDPIGVPRERRMRQIRIMLDHEGLPWPAEPVSR